MVVIIMKNLSLSEAKIKLVGLIDTVNTSNEEVVISKNGRPATVLVSLEEFESLKKTAAVRADSTLMNEIKEGLKALKKKSEE